MHDEHGPDAKILAVPAREPRYEGLRDLPDVPAHLRHFFNVFKELEPGKGTGVRGWQDLAAAEQEISAALDLGRGRAPSGRQPLHPRQSRPGPAAGAAGEQ